MTQRRVPTRVRAVVAAVLTLAITAFGVCALSSTPAAAGTNSAPAATGTNSVAERPNYHYTPAQHWMNDPNGLIYRNGVYHLFYQYNPTGDTGGNASWGHATSTDLVHWKEQPVAIPVDDTEEVWSGSVVNDPTNSSGLGHGGQGPMVAIYTSAVRATGVQRQSLAYSNDNGRTWVKYADNPVLDIGSHNFRDPKVFWYAPTKNWRMVVALSDQHKVAIYSSPDLKRWHQESTFGPTGVTSAVWECPDFFPMSLDGNPRNVKWVMVVNVAGRAEYFVGDFDGSTFTDGDASYTPPSGKVLADFEGTSYPDGWQTTGTAFGDGPVHDGTDGQIGTGAVDTFHTSDSDTGTLTSTPFTVDRPYLNFEIAGGNHPHVAGGSTAAPAGVTFEDFEGSDLAGWTGTGDLAGVVPSKETLSGQLGAGVLDTCQRGCDAAEGTLTSPTFTIGAKYVDLLIAGGRHPLDGANPTVVELVVDGTVVDSVTGNDSGSMDWVSLDASAYQGKNAQLRIVDQSDGSDGWGHIMVDNIVFSDVKAAPWDAQTGVNLIVDGQIVRTATGNDSGTLDWTSWDVKDLQGKQATLQLVDRNTGGWGHLIADQFGLADSPALAMSERAHWIDNGEDFYAAVTYNDAPGGRRIMVGWMNNWAYANDTPTSPWRGQQSVARELSLKTVAGVPQIVQQPVPSLLTAVQWSGTRAAIWVPVPSGTKVLPDSLGGSSARLDVVLSAGSAKRFGLVLRRSADGSQGTSVVYDTTTGTLSLDRNRSGDVAFSPAFPSVSSVKVPLIAGKLQLTILLDHNSIEVFGQNGRVALSDLVFPDASSSGIAATAVDGTARIDSLLHLSLEATIRR